MKKEVIIAIGLGIILGILIINGFNLANQASNNESGNALQISSPTPSPVNDQTSQSLISITYPEDRVVTNQSTIKLSIEYPEKTPLIVISPAGEQIISSNSTTYSTNLDLVPGENLIEVVGFLSDNSSTSSDIRIYYTTQEFK
jgi:hypothetical protein